ncbi:MAG: response regulator, partial [Thermoleophilaceae bacterium]
RDLKTVSSLIMSELTPTVSAQVGAFFLAEGDELELIASYGYRGGEERVQHGEGLVGQSAHEKQSILISEPPDDYIRISSGLGESNPANIIVLPVAFEERVLAVIELASFRPFSDVHLQFLEQLTETIGVSLNTIIANMRTEELLEQSQSLTQELQSQSGELQEQQEVLQKTNAELQEKAALLSQQNRDIEIKNREIEIARSNLEDKAEQLALSSKYKSEFLANMSHELRTPLNSLLILSKLLADNEDGSLNEKQVEYAGTIHTAGSDLLSLINDILDLSKVEAGKMEVRPAPIGLEAVRDYVERAFTPVAEEKGLAFEVALSDDLPEMITSDEQRLQQVLKNLLSNAFKFTDEGRVTLLVEPSDDARIAFSVADTGVGIPKDKLRLIFEAFQQGEGGTSRKYGGTGLGLSISREIARLLGGELDVRSTPGEGSKFTLYLPTEYVPVEAEAIAPVEPEFVEAALPEPATNGQPALEEIETAASEHSLVGPVEVADDRLAVAPGDRVVLVICADAAWAAEAVDAAHGRGFKSLIASRAEAGVALAHEFVPDAIVLAADTQPGTSGDGQDGTVTLDHLKRHPQTRHIPVYVEADQESRHGLLKAGAAGHLERPAGREELERALAELEGFVERRKKRVLIVEDDEIQRQSIVELIGAGDDVVITAVGSSEEALEQMAKRRFRFDCMVLDLNLPHLRGFELLEVIKKDERLRDIPVIVYTGKDLTTQEEDSLKGYAEAIIVKDASSPERLLYATSLYLHRPEARLSADKRRMLERLRDADEVFSGKKILLVDDDVRNVFALASLLESRGMEILFAENGLDGVKTLQEHPDVDLVLMDIMMPEMDGYEATRRIRGMDEFKQLPIVALTAKAMRGDREKSLMAGASDYVAKPVDTDRLLSLMRVWLHG